MTQIQACQYCVNCSRSSTRLRACTEYTTFSDNVRLLRDISLLPQLQFSLSLDLDRRSVRKTSWEQIVLRTILESCYTCIDASDKIFDCCLLRNSAPTTPCCDISITPLHTFPVNPPFILVPSGSPFFPIRAHALSSNLTTIPSFRCTFFAVRTIIACLMSPLLTLFAAAADVLPGPVSPIERDFCTTTMIRSP